MACKKTSWFKKFLGSRNTTESMGPKIFTFDAPFVGLNYFILVLSRHYIVLWFLTCSCSWSSVPMSGSKSWDLTMCKDLNFIAGSEKQDHLFAIGTLVMNFFLNLNADISCLQMLQFLLNRSYLHILDPWCWFPYWSVQPPFPERFNPNFPIEYQRR